MESGSRKRSRSSRRSSRRSEKRSRSRSSKKRSRSRSRSKSPSVEIILTKEERRKIILKILGTEDIPLVPKHLFALEFNDTEKHLDETSREDDVEKFRIWMKQTQKLYLQKIEAIANYLAYYTNAAATQDDKEFDYESSDYEYPNIDDFLKLGETEITSSRDFARDMARYTRDKKKSDGFDVGYYPYRDAARICGGGYVFRHYKPPEVNLPQADLNTLYCLAQLAISVYNKHQVQATDYCRVKVLKAMKFGTYGTDLNITFQAISPSLQGSYMQTFQTRVCSLNYPPRVPYSWVEIELVRKLKGGEDDSDKDLSFQETDYVGTKFIPTFPSSMEKLSDFDENDRQAHGIRYIELARSDETLAYLLCGFALHQFNIALYWHYRDEDEDAKINEINDDAEVSSVRSGFRTVNEEHGTTYYFIFQAPFIGNNGEPQTFETKLFMSPLIPTTKIKIKFVRIKGN